MNYKFIHAIVLTKEEYKDYKDETNFRDCTCGDYIVHVLVDKTNQEVIIREDNIHAPVENIIESFLEGLVYDNSNSYDLIYGFYIVPKDCYFDSIFSKETQFIELPY